MSTKSTGKHPRKRPRLTTLQGVRSYLGGVLQRLENGEIDEGQAKTRGYLGQILAKVVEKSDLETRVEALEKALEKNQESTSGLRAVKGGQG